MTLTISVLIASGVAAAPSAFGGVRADFVGLSSDELSTRSQGYRLNTLRAQRRIGVGLTRQVFDWARVEHAPGALSFAAYDDLVAAAARARVSVLPVLFGAPPFWSSAPPGYPGQLYFPPSSNAAFARFAAEAVRRYGPRGSLWRARPNLPRRPIRAWQIWNEPNLYFFWGGTPNAGQYTSLLAAAHRAIKQVDRKAEVVSGALANPAVSPVELQNSVPFDRFAAEMYRHGARSAFETFAINPFALTHRGTLQALRTARRLMNRLGDRRAGLWMTEWGWATGGRRSFATRTKRGQAREISGVLKGLRSRRLRRFLRLRGMVYYQWRDGNPGASDLWPNHTGLVTFGGRRKPSFHEFKAGVARLGG